MRVDDETKVAFITNKKGEVKIYDFKEVNPSKIPSKNNNFLERYTR